MARPTADIARLVPFYRDGLGFRVLAEFRDHDGFDGAVLGHPRAPWHLEFTRHPDHPPLPPSPENLLVFYLPDPEAHRAACARMEAAGHVPVPASNPYWDRSGRTYADPDGWRVVLAARAWTG
ncbi:VOC family protein [Jannaschia sp. W003]|uniref:VOC family protein n=1 Tax=Jannaschia sp. W003 TaxID=2867012 RepID=UPI0021A637A6|nr:VOC family protein [Jannaschia sp. W003]UWQ20620.1 VOC family protein [Jannaschia sp. W003]